MCVRAGGQAWLAPHKGPKKWEPGWNTVLFVFLPMGQGQLTWHVHKKWLHLYEPLGRALNVWDGSGKEERDARLLKWLKQKPAS